MAVCLSSGYEHTRSYSFALVCAGHDEHGRPCRPGYQLTSRCAAGVLGQLILALCRDSQPNRALALYHDRRELFVRELGSEPGQQLGVLYQAIINEDPNLSTGADNAFLSPETSVES
ncbi:hypothetical protein GCM10018955_24690 [Planomonospora venezuelensis]